jgi:hypothetical protein
MNERYLSRPIESGLPRVQDMNKRYLSLASPSKARQGTLVHKKASAHAIPT